MVFAFSMRQVSPKIAVKAYRIAWRKVEGKEDLHEAWALGWIGWCLCH
jgi:hypothetical protein